MKVRPRSTFSGFMCWTNSRTYSFAGRSTMSSGVPAWMMRPPSRMAIWLPSFSASSRSWLTKMIVLRTSFCSASNSSCSLVRMSGSSAENGSSISRMSASVAKARARPTRCCMPPDNSRAYLSAHWSSATSLSFLVHDAAALGGRNAAEFEPQPDILPHRAPGQQSELLKHHRDAAGAHEAQRRAVATRDIDLLVLVAHQHAPACHAC